MKWPLPGSLFGRMVLVMIAGLVIAQVVSTAILFRERERMDTQGRAMRASQRIADVVRVLDELAAADRERLVPLMSTRVFQVTLGETAPPPVPPDEAAAQRAEHLGAALRLVLGDERRIVTGALRVDRPLRGRRGGEPRETGDTPPPRAPEQVVALVARIDLADGSVATFQQVAFAPPPPPAYRPVLDIAIRLAAVVLLCLVAVRWVTRPLSTLASAAQALGDNINRPPLAESGPTEVRHAAQAFNRMQSRLLAYLNDRTRVLAAISHDLKTPITRMRLRTELLDDAALREKFERDLADMEHMVSGALEFMRGIDNGEAWQTIDPQALVESMAEDARETGQDVLVEGAAQPISARPLALKRCLANLVDNAVKHGGRARIVLADSAAALVVHVRDNGPGIPAEQLEQVFEPFFRLDASRNRETGGSGLGLTIARNIAQLHGGTLVLANLPEGGLDAVLTLPRQHPGT